MPAIFNPDDVGRCGASTLRRPSVYACVEGVGHETQSENKRSVVDPVFCIFLCLDEYIRVPGRGDPVFPEGAVPEWSGAADCRKQHGGFQADIVCAAAMPAGIGVPVLCGSVSVFCNFYAIDRLLLASSNSLNKLAPFFAIVLAACFLGERIGRRQAVCMAVAFAGSLFLIVPSLDTRGLPCLIALIGAATSGGAFVSLRALQRVGILAPSVIVFFFSLTTTTIALVPSVLFWTPMRAQQLLFLLLAGMACAIGQFALTYAYRYAAPREISLCDCTQIVFSGILGFYILDQVPSGESLIAYVLIVAASAMLLCSREPMRTSGAE